MCKGVKLMQICSVGLPDHALSDYGVSSQIDTSG